LLVALVLGAQLICVAETSAQSISLTTTSWGPGPDASGIPTFSGTVDQPTSQRQLTGWVVDTTAEGWTGVDGVQIWNGLMNAGGQQVATAEIQISRPDVAAVLNNPYWAPSGFAATLPSNAFSASTGLYVYAHTPAKGWWYLQVLSSTPIGTFTSGPELNIEMPGSLATVHAGQAYTMRGFAFDPTATPQQGSGIDRIQVYLNGDRSSGVPIGDATLGQFDKFAAAKNQQFAQAGWQLSFQPNSWITDISDDTLMQVTVYAHSSVTGAETQAQTTIIVSVP
jgi:hypothetical protein